MRRQSGICIELNHDRSIFLVEDGQFVKGLPAGNPSIGEKASFYPFEKKPAIRWQPILAPVIAAVAAFILFMSVLVLPAEEAFGYVQVQINPGVELGINDQYEVVSVRELNSDGHDLIHQLGDWKNDSLFNVLKRVFDLAVTEKTTEIMVTAVEEDRSEFDQAIKNVVLAVSSGVENEQLAIQMKEATKEQWRRSKEDHIPVGQLIQKVETLKNQPESNVQNSVEKTETVTDPKEKKAVNEQKTKIENKKKNNEKEKKNNKPIDENKKIPQGVEKKADPPAVDKKATPPAAEKKQSDPSPKAEQQKKPKSYSKPEEPGNKNKNAPPTKEQEKAKPPKPVPKEKPAEKKEESQSERKPQPNGEAPGQQRKNNEPAVNSSSINKTEPQQSLNQEKKKGQAPDHSREDKRQDQKEIENSPISENKQGNKAEE